MNRRSLIVAAFACGFFAFAAQPASANVKKALEHAHKAAAEYLKKGFSLREDNWKGKMSVGKKKAIKHQLYKGNEYWFWLGTSTPDVKLTVRVYDSKGRPVDVETKSDKKSAAARVLAPKTGTYYIVIHATPAKPKDKKKFKKDAVEWALVYGYR